MCSVVNPDKIALRILTEEDLLNFKNFTAYDSILLVDYNLCFMNEKELLNWKNKINKTKYYYYAICLDEMLIGYVSARGSGLINTIYEMSICLDAKYSSKGIGFYATRKFLKKFFTEFKQEYIVLNVNSFNKRAIKMYEKLGFEKISEFLGDFEVQNFQYLKEFEENKECFCEKKGVLYSKNYTMKLNRNEFFERWG